jgi:hypothetical protein
MPGKILRKKNRPRLGRVNQAYISLMLTPESDDGSRTVSLARYGVYEVQLVEVPHVGTRDASPLWINLYRRDTRCSLDSCRCDDLDDAEMTVQDLLSQAKRLHEAEARSCMPPLPR